MPSSSNKNCWWAFLMRTGQLSEKSISMTYFTGWFWVRVFFALIMCSLVAVLTRTLHFWPPLQSKVHSIASSAIIKLFSLFFSGHLEKRGTISVMITTVTWRYLCASLHRLVHRLFVLAASLEKPNENAKLIELEEYNQQERAIKATTSTQLTKVVAGEYKSRWVKWLNI